MTRATLLVEVEIKHEDPEKVLDELMSLLENRAYDVDGVVTAEADVSGVEGI